MHQNLYLGIKGHVVCIEKDSGRELWRTLIKGSQLTNILVDDDGIFAYSGGHLFCLSPADGTIRWKSDLPGLGFGYCILATRGSGGSAAATSNMGAQAAQTAAVVAASSAAAVAASS
jgi:outer membrane protein assembly factor BamB